jgi:hypothetical protein
MDRADPIRRAAVVSTGQVQIRPDQLVLFDAGQDRASVTDPGYFPGDPAAASRLAQATGQVPTLATV